MIETDRNGMVVLTRRDCFRLLGRKGFGRVGLSIDALPAILPVTYAVEDGEIYFRSSPGAKLAAATDNAVVAFEVDCSDPVTHTGWSVLVVGRAERIATTTDNPRLPLRRWIGEGDDVLVRIRPEVVSGRQIEMSAS